MIIVVAHQKGGVGKSTIATNLSAVMNADLLDLDAQHSSILWNCSREDQIEKGKRASITKKPLNHIKCFTLKNSGCRFPHQTPVPDEKLYEFLEGYAEPKKDIVIDCPGMDGRYNRFALAGADYILTPVSPSGVEVFGLKSFEEILIRTEEAARDSMKRAGRDPKESDVHFKTHVLINRADPRSPQRIRELQEFVTSYPEHFKLCKTQVSILQDYPRAYEDGLSVVERNYNSQSAKEMLKLKEEIRKKLREERED